MWKKYRGRAIICLSIKKHAGAFILIVYATARFAVAQGPLAPPSAPAPAMKTLEQIEPRTLIASLPYTISSPGSYIVVSNLSSTEHGIIVDASYVTLDLGGFTLTGDGGFGESGILINGTNSATSNIEIRHGTLTQFSYGLKANLANHCRLEKLQVSSNANYGIYFSGQNGRCNGNATVDCTLSGNSTALVLDGFLGQCSGNSIERCMISGNSDGGIYLYGFSGECRGNVIQGCAINLNENRGIYIDYAEANRVHHNNISSQTGTVTYAVQTENSSQNLITSNYAYGHTTNYTFSANDVYGPIVTATGSLDVTGTTAHAWANFSY